MQSVTLERFFGHRNVVYGVVLFPLGFIRKLCFYGVMAIRCRALDCVTNISSFFFRETL